MKWVRDNTKWVRNNMKWPKQGGGMWKRREDEEAT